MSSYDSIDKEWYTKRCTRKPIIYKSLNEYEDELKSSGQKEKILILAHGNIYKYPIELNNLFDTNKLFYCMDLSRKAKPDYCADCYTSDMNYFSDKYFDIVLSEYLSTFCSKDLPSDNVELLLLHINRMLVDGGIYITPPYRLTVEFFFENLLDKDQILTLIKKYIYKKSTIDAQTIFSLYEKKENYVMYINKSNIFNELIIFCGLKFLKKSKYYEMHICQKNVLVTNITQYDFI